MEPFLVICIKCGSEKAAPLDPCNDCGHTPEEFQEVESIYCSTERFQTKRDKLDYIPKLRRIAQTIRKGEAVQIDSEERARIESIFKCGDIRDNPNWTKFYLKLLGPSFMLLAAVFFALLLIFRILYR